MASEVSICNVALIRCGTDTIMSLTEPGNKGARLCNAVYTDVRDALIRAHPWNFAVRRASLPRTGNAPAFEFANEFTLPEDCLKVQSVYCEFPYRVERAKVGAGKVIVTDAEAVRLEYIARVTDANQMDPTFRNALSLAIAATICVGINDNATLAKVIAEEAESALSLARSIDSHEGTPRDPVDDDIFLRARI